MAIRPKKPCNRPGCRELVNTTYCKEHADIIKRKNWKQIDQNRESSTKRGYGYKWKKARDGFLVSHPLCAECEDAGRTTAAGVVDHKIPHKGDMILFWDKSNWQSLCAPCHNRKSAMEGAFNRRKAPTV